MKTRILFTALLVFVIGLVFYNEHAKHEAETASTAQAPLPRGYNPGKRAATTSEKAARQLLVSKGKPIPYHLIHAHGPVETLKSTDNTWWVAYVEGLDITFKSRKKTDEIEEVQRGWSLNPKTAKNAVKPARYTDPLDHLDEAYQLSLKGEPVEFTATFQRLGWPSGALGMTACTAYLSRVTQSERIQDFNHCVVEGDEWEDWLTYTCPRKPTRDFANGVEIWAANFKLEEFSYTFVPTRR